MIFAIAIPQFFGFERSSEGTTTTTLTKDGRILQLDGWMAGLVQLYQLSGNRCVCVWRTRWWNDTVGVWVGAWLFIFFSTQPAPVLSSAVRLLLLAARQERFFSCSTHRPRYNHTPDHHISIFHGSAGREATRHWLRVSVSHSSSSSSSGTAQLPRSYTAEGSQLAS